MQCSLVLLTRRAHALLLCCAAPSSAPSSSFTTSSHPHPPLLKHTPLQPPSCHSHSLHTSLFQSFSFPFLRLFACTWHGKHGVEFRWFPVSLHWISMDQR